MAERTEGSTEVAATPAAIMEVLLDYDAYPEWAGVKTAEVVERDSKGRPSRIAMTISQMGFDAAYTLQNAYAPRNGGFSWSTLEASGAVKDVQGEYVLEPSADGTKVTYRLALELGISLPGFLKRQAAKQVITAALGDLKKRVEAR